MRPTRRPARAAVVAALVLVVAVLASGCTVAIAGRALAAAQVSAGVDPSFIRGTDGGEDDQLAAATLTDLQGFWRETLPSIGGGRALDPVPRYFSVDSSTPGAPPPCLPSTEAIEGNAYYCPGADVLGYDRAALLPVLRQEFGDTAVVVVLAHEFGHVLQERLDASAAGPGSDASIPTILSEGQADCYGGLFVRQVREGRTPNLRTDVRGVDAAMAAILTFRDPVGTGASDDNAHGNAFDRVSSFQTGFDGDAAACAGMSLRNREFTQTEFQSLADASTQGNLPLDQLIRSMGPDLDRFFGELVRGRSGRWTPPAMTEGGATCAGGVSQGPVTFCGAIGGGAPSVSIDAAALGSQHDTIGDYASGTLLASRYGLAALAALGQPTEGEEAGRRTLCLAGAYTGSLGDAGGGFGLSPGDLDEAVQMLLRSDRAAVDADGAAGAGTAYERIRVFRGGVAGGAASCL